MSFYHQSVYFKGIYSEMTGFWIDVTNRVVYVLLTYIRMNIITLCKIPILLVILRITCTHIKYKSRKLY